MYYQWTSTKQELQILIRALSEASIEADWTMVNQYIGQMIWLIEHLPEENNTNDHSNP